MDKQPEPARDREPAAPTEPPCDEVDTSSFDSFPASDPPSWTPIAGTGSPSRDEETPSKEESQ